MNGFSIDAIDEPPRALFGMVDTLTKSERSERMSRVKGKDSKPELIVRRLVHAMGVRYRLHVRSLPGTPDLVFNGRRRVIFVHGCFWHRHSDPNCKLARMPKTRLDFWEPKLQGNRERDLRHQNELIQLGWNFLVVWECQLREKEQLENILATFLGKGDHE